MNEKMVFIHDVKLNGESKFVKNFNYCSELFQRTKEDGISKEEYRNRMDAFWSYKYCLEQGII